MSRALTEEEFNEWKLHPMTRELSRVLEAKRETLRRQWESGAFTDYEREATALVNVGNLGTCKGYAFVVDFTYEDYIGELDDGEFERAGTPGGGSTD
jgi:hypothetical protein